MSKSNKIIVVAISVTLALCLTVVGVTSIVNEKNPASAENTEAVCESVPTSGAEAFTDETAPLTGDIVSDSAAVSDTTTAPTEVTSASGLADTTAPTQDISGSIIGKWMDSAGMSGFEFFSDGKVSFTYVNLSSFGVPFDGTARNGIYTLEGNIVTIKFSIYTATIEKKYEVSVENDVLSMRDIEENDTSTYTRVSTADGTTTTSVAIPTAATTEAPVSATDIPENTQQQIFAFEGRFLSADKKNEITFNPDGTVEIKIKRDDFNGVYQVTGDKVMIVYIDDGESVSESYTFTLEGNILTLVSSKGEASVYIKQ